MKEEDCIGCATMEPGDCSWFDEILNCPCINCLIKMMCRTECLLLRKHTTKIFAIRDVEGLIAKGKDCY